MEAGTGTMAGEVVPATLIGTTGRATHAARETDGLEERKACGLIRRDPLDRSEGDVVGMAADGALDMGHAPEVWPFPGKTKSGRPQHVVVYVSGG